jgi:dipeptidyl aminopeptidase/acylaminoacyl peptidase
MNARSLVSTLFILTLLPSVLAVAQEPDHDESSPSPRNLEIDDTFKIKSVGGANLSHDGKRMAYTVTTRNYEKNSSKSRVWMTATKGGTPIPMTAEAVSSWSPQFSRDGKTLYFLSARNDDKTQLWSLDLINGGEGKQVTNVERGVGSINLSRDEKKLLLVLKDPDPDKPDPEKSGKEEADKEDDSAKKWVKGKPWVIDRIQFKKDYVGYLDRRRNHVYVYDLETEELTQITSGDYDDASPAWSPDGKTVAFSSNRTEEPDINFNTDIWLVDADNTDKGKNLIQLTTSGGPDSSPTWHPDGKSIAYVSAPDLVADEYATGHLAVIDSQGGEPKLLTKDLDRYVSSLEFSEDGRYIYFELEDSGEDHIARIRAKGGKITRPIKGHLSASGFDLASNGTLVAKISKPDLPAEIFIADNGDLRQLTQVNKDLFSQIRLGETEEIHFKSHDGLEIEGFITKPPSFNPTFRYPTILLIHGGPVSQYSYGFSFEAQLFAANDYVVVRANPRGSSGYGQAFSFALYQGWGEKDYRDVIAAVDHAIELGYADPDRLGVGGFSYGGILTNYIITQTDRFKGAVSGAGAGLYAAGYGHDLYQRSYERELGLPWENPELYARLSPFTHIKNATTPTLFVCGEKDWNVAVQNSEQLYQAMARLGRTTQLVVYPGEHHGGWTAPHQKDYLERRLAWYAQYVKGEDPNAADEAAK